MFLTPKIVGPGTTSRREKSDHLSVDDAKLAFAKHPSRKEFEALIYIDGSPSWVGSTDWEGRVEWSSWTV